MRRSKSRDTILAAARAEFGEHGFAGARIGRVAARSGLNKQLIYYYFGSKAGLYDAATAGGPFVPVPPPETASGAPDALRRALSHLVATLQSRPDLVALVVDRSPASGPTEDARAWIRDAGAAIATRVSQGQGMGYFRDDVEPHVVARQALVLCLGFLALRRYVAVSENDWVREVGDTLLRSIAW